MSEHAKHLVPAGDGTFVVVLEPGCLECAQAAIDRALIEPPAPVDWPARFRAAAEVAEREEWDDIAIVFRKVAHEMRQWMTPEEVEAIGRALLGETS